MKIQRFFFCIVPAYSYLCKVKCVRAMKESEKSALEKRLIGDLEERGLRKTPERLAIFQSACDFPNMFTFDELMDAMHAKGDIIVSRATLYNTLKLFLDLRLINTFRLSGKMRYEVVSPASNHVRQICMKCGKLTDVRNMQLVHMVQELHLKRFRQDGFLMNIYGICSTCQARITREENKNKIKLQNGKGKS